MKKLLPLILLGITTMSGAEPIIKNSYTFFNAIPFATAPAWRYVFATTIDNQALIADMSGVEYSGKSMKPNPDFGVYSIPMDADLIKDVKTLDKMLTNKALMQNFKNNGREKFSYVVSNGNQSYNDTIDYNIGGTMDTSFRHENLPKEELKIEEASYFMGSTLQRINDMHSKKRKLIATMNTTYDLKQTEKGLKVIIHFNTTGDLNTSITHPSDLKVLNDGDVVDAFKQWISISLGGLYNGVSYSTEIYLLPEYLTSTTLSESEKKDSSFIELKSNGVRDLEFLVPYNKISFYSDKTKTHEKWNDTEGNRDAKGFIKYDYAALSGAWYLNVQMKIFSAFVLHVNEPLTQLKWQSTMLQK